ncbi:MAG TPA: transcription antitermination factor NusB [Candidatus Acidoferrum sp.]|nr:transcription antitermination factor NusB [Candidatus Acidoferrum sp.]
MGFRAKARECAMQMLFQSEMSPQDPKKLEAQFWRSAKGSDTTREFANALFEGAVRDVAGLDELISKTTAEANWKFERIAAIDRAILRLGIHELRQGETPARVVINESVELAKKFSSEDASAFVNAVLDSVRKSLIKN